MVRSRRVLIAKICGYSLGVGNLALFAQGPSTTLTSILVVVLAPFTLALALKLTASLACSTVSLALGDRRERTELLICAIAGLQPSAEGEQYREAMLAENHVAASDQVLAIRANLMKNAPKTILAAWVHPKPLSARRATLKSASHRTQR